MKNKNDVDIFYGHLIPTVPLNNIEWLVLLKEHERKKGYTPLRLYAFLNGGARRLWVELMNRMYIRQDCGGILKIFFYKANEYIMTLHQDI